MRISLKISDGIAYLNLCEEKYPLKLAKAYTEDVIAEF
jgi:hypothetical protein